MRYKDRCPICGRPKPPINVACSGCCARVGFGAVRSGALYVIPVALADETPAQVEARERKIAAAWARLRRSRETYGED